MAIGGVALACALAYAAWLYAPIVQSAISVYRDVHTVTVPAPREEAPLPQQIIHIANRQVEDWARESVAARARELYEQCKDWGTVAHQLEQEGGDV